MKAIQPHSQLTPFTPLSPEPNWMGKFVRWIRNDEVPNFQKIGAIALAALALLTLGFLSGHPTLVPPTLTLLSLVWAARELKNIDPDKEAADEEGKVSLWEHEETEEPTIEATPTHSSLQRITDMKLMIGAFSGEEEWGKIPSLSRKIGQSRLTPKSLKEPVMRGIDDFSNKFIAMKIISQNPPFKEKVLVGVEIIDDEGQKTLWYRGFNDHGKELTTLGLKEIEEIRKGVHPDYRIAEQTGE